MRNSVTLKMIHDGVKKQYATTIRRLKFHKSGTKTKLTLSQSKSTTLPKLFGSINIQFGQQNCHVREERWEK